MDILIGSLSYISYFTVFGAINHSMWYAMEIPWL